MSLVTVKDKYQVVIPQGIRKQLGIQRGDLLEAKIERGKLTYIPKTVLDRVPQSSAERRQFFKRLREEAPGWLQESWTSSKRGGSHRLTMREINAAVAAVRRRETKRKSKPRDK